MITQLIRRMAAIATLTAALASQSAAQIRVEVGATLGHYKPFGSFAPASVSMVSLPHAPSALAGTALGGQFRVWVAPRFAIQLAGSTATSSVGGGSTPNGYAPAVSARVSMATAEVLYQLTGRDHRARIWLEAGGAVVRHGGDAYKPFGFPVNRGGVAGIGSAIRLAGPLSVELGLTTIVYRMNMHGTAATDLRVLERETQVDARFHTGLSVGWH